MKKIVLSLQFLLLNTAFPSCPLEDLRFIYSTVLENHPGVYNDQDKDFRNNLCSAYEKSYAAIMSKQSEDESYDEIFHFVNSFGDGHLGVELKNAIAEDTKNEISHKSFGIQNLDNDIHWVSLPTFAPQDDQKRQLRDIVDKVALLRKSKAIIFDVSGNGGGSSYWGTEIVKSLFSVEYAQNALSEARKGVYTEWRASKANIDYLAGYLPSFEKDYGAESSTTIYLKNLIKDLRGACEHNIPLCCSKYSGALQKQDSLKKKAIHHEVSASIFVVIDERCFSACLNFIDDLKAMNYPITLVGKATGSDTVYMDIRTVLLPSGKGKFWFPMKVYRNRVRGNNESYYPDMEYSDDTQSVGQLQRHVIKLVAEGE